MALGCHPAPPVPRGNREVEATGEESEPGSGKVTLADPIRVSHLFIALRAREELTQAEQRPQYRMNGRGFFFFLKQQVLVYVCMHIVHMK